MSSHKPTSKTKVSTFTSTTVDVYVNQKPLLIVNLELKDEE